MFFWGTPDNEHLFQQWFWYRDNTAGDTQEFSLDNLTFNSGSNPAANEINLNYGGNVGESFSVNVNYVLDGPSLTESTITETVTITNTSGEGLDLQWFEYTDLDMDDQVSGDSAFADNPGKITQFSPFGSQVDVEVIGGPAPTAYAIEEYSDIVDDLEDGSITDLSTMNQSDLNSVDITHAFEWNLFINAGESAVITKTKSGTFEEVTGVTQFDPLIVPLGPNGFVFNEVPGELWFDPPFAESFEYEMLDGNLFTIVGLPTGINGIGELFEIYVNDILVATAAGGEFVDFVTLLGDGVSSFRIGNIAAPDGVDVDPNIQDPFPTFLAFNESTASISMNPVPMASSTVSEPGTVMLLIAGLAMTVGWRRRQFRQGLAH